MKEKVKRPHLKSSFLHTYQPAWWSRGPRMFSDQGRSGSPAYYLITPLWQPGSLVRSGPTECQRGGMMMYLSDASVFHLLTLLFFSFVSVSTFCPSAGDVSPIRAGQSKLLTLCVPGAGQWKHFCFSYRHHIKYIFHLILQSDDEILATLDSGVMVRVCLNERPYISYKSSNYCLIRCQNI